MISKIDELKEKITSRGYWRINFQPLVYSAKFPSLGKCKETMEKTKVSLRGWDYPHVAGYTNDNQGIEPGEDYYEGWATMEEYGIMEFWRMFLSGQFIHYRSLTEDWRIGLTYRNMWEHDRQLEPGDVLGVTNTIYMVTEIFQFLSRLVAEGIYDEGVELSIGLNKTTNRELVVDHPQRIPFTYPRRTSAEKIEFAKTLEKKDLLERPKDLAFDTIIFFFDRFAWHDANVEVIKLDQEKLISRQP